MKAGFAKVSITPPLGTRMLGWVDRDQSSGCKGVHDPIFVRALYVEEGTEKALVLSYDTCFIGRSESDQLKGAIGRDLEMTPRQILISATHSHAGPALGAWAGAPPSVEYVADVVDATRRAAQQARSSSRQAVVSGGMGKSKLPVSRRKFVEGQMQNAPNRAGVVCDALPVCELRDAQTHKPICLLFSCSTHPVIFRGWDISAEYCGNACDKLDAHLGAECSLFLQGCAGDSRPATVDLGEQWNWSATYAEVESAGKMLAGETIKVLQAGLKPSPSRLRSALIETHWPLLPPPTRAELEKARDNTGTTMGDELRRWWGNKQLSLLQSRGTLADDCPVIVQAIQLADDVRLVAIEGEPVADHGLHILKSFGGVTFPLGYANGEAAYLPSSRMLPEGGYEVTSYYEYGHPSQLAAGMEQVLEKTFQQFKQAGIS